MKKLDKIGTVFNIVLAIVYIPLSLFSFLMQMLSETTIGATNPLYIALVEIICAIALVVALLCPVAIAVSVILRMKGYSKASFIAQFIPLALFVLNMIFTFVMDFIPKKI